MMHNVLGCVDVCLGKCDFHTQSYSIIKKLQHEKIANTLEFKVINTDANVFPQILESLLFPGGGRAVQKMQGSGKAIALKR